MTTNIPTTILAPRELAVLKAIRSLNYAATISDVAVKSGYAFSSTETALKLLEQSYRMIYRSTNPGEHPIRYRITAAGIIELREIHNCSKH
jgi:hypothetical protein